MSIPKFPALQKQLPPFNPSPIHIPPYVDRLIFSPMLTHWSVLIGINHYKTHPLNGAVKDVTLIQNVLQSSFESESIDITCLTATSSSDPDNNPTEHFDS